MRCIAKCQSHKAFCIIGMTVFQISHIYSYSTKSLCVFSFLLLLPLFCIYRPLTSFCIIQPSCTLQTNSAVFPYTTVDLWDLPHHSISKIFRYTTVDKYSSISISYSRPLKYSCTLHTTPEFFLYPAVVLWSLYVYHSRPRRPSCILHSTTEIFLYNTDS